MDGSIFRTQGLSAGYGRRVILSGVEITAERGRITTLIGPNGCGKSTLLRTASRQLAALSGSVFISGSSLRDIGANELARKLSILLTERISPELMTCRDVVESGRYPYTGQLGILSEADRAAVEEAMALTSTTELSGVEFTRISDGQRQRVMLARAICQQPELLILDEPTSYLDIRHKLELLNTLKRLVREKNIAVLMSLHELELAERVSDKIICVDGGKIGLVGTPEEIFSAGYISRLYGINEESFSEANGCAELEKPAGAPEVFVISGGGKSSGTFRRLQRMGIPFAAGIIPENDIDFPVAKALAAEVLSYPAFSRVPDGILQRGLRLIGECESVICCPGSCGELSVENPALLKYAREQGKQKEQAENPSEINGFIRM